MFSLSWRGYGLAGILLPVACLAQVVMLLGDIDHPAGAKLFWGLLLASSPLLWWLGNRLNGEAEPGEEPHRFMGLSLQKVPLIYLGLFGLYLLGKAMQ